MAGYNEAGRRAADDSEPGASWFVWAVWAAAAGLASAFVVRFGPDLPVWDDDDVVTVIAGGRRVTLEWLWSLHNEHRVPLPRLLLLALYRLSGNDFRAGMGFSVAALAVLAGASVVVAGRRRGGGRSYDALFPLVLLSLSHHANLLWSWQVQFVLATSVAGAILLVVLARDDWPGGARASAVGVGLAALCLCGANGLALVPALACWLIAGSLAHWNSGRPRGRRTGAVVLASSVPSLLILVLYFTGYRPAGPVVSAPGVAAALKTGLRFLSLMFGTAARDFWPASGLTALAVVGSSVVVVARAALVGPPGERPRALGLLCGFAAFGSLVLGLGWGRAGANEAAGFEPRYVTIIAPVWVAVVFAWDLYAPPAVRRFVLTALLSVALVLVWPNTRDGLEHGRDVARQARRFERDLKGGMPIYRLVKQYTPFLHPSQDTLAEELELLRRARIGIFRHLRADPEFREIPVPVVPADVRMARWENGTAHVDGVDPAIRFVLPEAVTVAAIRLKYSHANRVGGPARFRFVWGTAAGQGYSNWALPTGRDRVTMVWVADRIKEFSIQPDNQPCEFTIGEITLLVPPLIPSQ